MKWNVDLLAKILAFLRSVICAFKIYLCVAIALYMCEGAPYPFSL